MRMGKMEEWQEGFVKSGCVICVCRHPLKQPRPLMPEMMDMDRVSYLFETQMSVLRQLYVWDDSCFFLHLKYQLEKEDARWRRDWIVFLLDFNRISDSYLFTFFFCTIILFSVIFFFILWFDFRFLFSFFFFLFLFFTGVCGRFKIDAYLTALNLR